MNANFVNVCDVNRKRLVKIPLSPWGPSDPGTPGSPGILAKFGMAGWPGSPGGPSAPSLPGGPGGPTDPGWPKISESFPGIPESPTGPGSPQFDMKISIIKSINAYSTTRRTCVANWSRRTCRTRLAGRYWNFKATGWRKSWPTGWAGNSRFSRFSCFSWNTRTPCVSRNATI